MPQGVGRVPDVESGMDNHPQKAVNLGPRLRTVAPGRGLVNWLVGIGPVPAAERPPGLPFEMSG